MGSLLIRDWKIVHQNANSTVTCMLQSGPKGEKSSEVLQRAELIRLMIKKLKPMVLACFK